MPVVLRNLAFVVGLIVVSVIGAAGFVAVIAGLAEQNAADSSYSAEFGSPGDDCGSGGEHFNEANGQVLACAGGASPEATVSFPGFTAAQDKEIEALAQSLGTDGLSEADQDLIQQRIDEFAATVPESDRPHHDEGMFGPLRGTGLAWTGGAALVLGGLGAVLLVRRF